MLELSDNRTGTECLMAIVAPKEELSFKGLHTLDLSNNRLSVSDVQALNKATECGRFAHLHSLNLEGSLTDNVDINADLLNTFASCCYGLLTVKVSHNVLGIPGAKALSRIILKSSCLILMLYPCIMKEAMGHTFHSIGPQFIVTLNETNLGDSGLIAFVEGLAGQTCFDTLDLKGNGIRNTGISCLIEAINSERIIIANELFEFHLGNNPLGTSGILAISKMLSNNHYEFTGLNLSQCQLTNTKVTIPPSSESDCNVMGVRDVGQLLCQLPQTDIFFDLTLDGNSFTGDAIHILAGLMHLCPHLMFFSCISCQITSGDLLQLFDIVFSQSSPSSQRPCRKLIGWHLDQNRIDDKGFDALFERLPSLFPKLGYGFSFHKLFTFDANPVSPEMAKRINNEMERRYEEEKLKAEKSLAKASTVNQHQTAEEQPKMASTDYVSSATDTFIVTAGDKREDPPSTHTSAPPLSYSADILVPSTTLSSAEPRLYTYAEVSTDPKDCIIKVDPGAASQENAIESPNMLSSTDNSDKVDKASHLLTVNDLASIQRAVWEGRAKWYNIGLELGLTAGTLDAIQLDNPHHSEHCFTATLKEWLSRADLQPSLDSLANALRALPVGLGELAEALSNLKL